MTTLSHVNDPSSLPSFLCGAAISSSLQDVCKCALSIVSDASPHQINTAIEYNQNQINTLLIQLLTINFIKQNENIIQNEIEKFNNQNHDNDRKQLENYCNQKLLEISPIHGFSPKTYFQEYNVSDDIRMDILTYLKPIQLFKTITLLNKQFNKNVKKMHSSTNSKYNKVFETSNFTFDSFLEMEEYCTNTKRKALYNGGRVRVDWMSTNGFFYFDEVTDISTFQQHITVNNCPTSLNNTYVAPYGCITCRPCNKNKFVNTIIKRGYFNELCDINISKYAFYGINKKNELVPFDITRGFVSSSEYMTLQQLKSSNVWICGKINFLWTLNNSWYRSGEQQGISVDENDLKNGKKYNKLVSKLIKPFEIFQIYVDIDITGYYNKYNDTERSEILQYFENNLAILNDGRRILLTVAAHGDDSCLLTYFGDKSSIDCQKRVIANNYHNWIVDKPKQRFLDLIGYPNYCLITPEGAACRLKNKEKFEKWEKFWVEDDMTMDTPVYLASGVMQLEINKDVLKKIYYDKEKDELCIRILFRRLTLRLFDSDIPVPLKNRYNVTFASPQRPKLVDGVITEPGIIEKLEELEELEEREKKTDIDKKEMYFQRLETWRGLIRFTFDITNVFDEFQERLREDLELNSNHVNENDDSFSNRRYFVNSNGKDMSYLKWDRKKNKISYDCYADTYLSNIVDYDFQLKFLDRLGIHKRKILLRILNFGSDSDIIIFRCVCKEWENLVVGWV